MTGKAKLTPAAGAGFQAAAELSRTEPERELHNPTQINAAPGVDDGRLRRLKRTLRKKSKSIL